MEEFREVFMRQVVNGHDCFGPGKWRQDILTVEDLWFGFSQEPRQSNPHADGRVFGDGNKRETRIISDLRQSFHTCMENNVLIVALVEDQPTQELPKIGFVSSGP